MVLVNNQYIANSGMDFEPYINKILEYGVTTLYLRASGTLSETFKFNVFEALLGQNVHQYPDASHIAGCASEAVSQFYISELVVPSALRP